MYCLYKFLRLFASLLLEFRSFLKLPPHRVMCDIHALGEEHSASPSDSPPSPSVVRQIRTISDLRYLAKILKIYLFFKNEIILFLFLLIIQEVFHSSDCRFEFLWMADLDFYRWETLLRRFMIITSVAACSKWQRLFVKRSKNLLVDLGTVIILLKICSNNKLGRFLDII